MKLLLTVLLLLLPLPLFAATYYVATDGDNGDPGTEAEPWQTIAYANTQLSAGDSCIIRAGTYAETIDPDNNGSSGNEIVYKAYDGELVKITASTGADLRNTHYVVIDSLQFWGNYSYWINMEHSAPADSVCSHHIIKNCYFRGLRNGWGGIYMEYGVKWIQILNNEFHAVCDGDTAGGEDVICGYGGEEHILVQGNDFHYAAHACIALYAVTDTSRYLIVRNNTIDNPWHTGGGTGGNLEQGMFTQYSLTENNTYTNCGEDYLSNACYTPAAGRHLNAGFQSGGKNVIIRRNTLYNNGMNSVIDSLIYVYHNSFDRQYRAIYDNLNEPLIHQCFKNNIFSDSYQYSFFFATTDAKKSPNYFFNNCFHGYESAPIHWEGSDWTLSSLHTNHPTQWGGNISDDPLWDSSYNLSTASPCIDTGADLTTVTSANGSGTSFVVADVGYFCDGWGMITADSVYVGDDKCLITSIDYSTNTITVNGSITWVQGDAVNLPYKNSGPDMGRYEFESPADEPTIPPHAWFVSSGGNDNNTGKSAAAPLLTIAALLDSAITIGDSLFVCRGDTFEATINTAASQQLIAAYGSGAKPVLTGSDVRAEPIHIDEDSTTVRNLDLQHGADNGILVLADHFSIEDCDLSSNGNHGILVYTDAATITSGTISECESSDNGNVGIFVTKDGAAAANGLTIEKCSSHDNAGDGICLRNASDNIVRYCHLYDNGYEGLDGYGGSDSLTVFGCLIHGNTTSGILINAGGASGSIDHLIYNNTIANNLAGACQFDSTVTGAVIKNNIFSMDTTVTGNDPCISITGDSLGENNSFDYNLYYQQGDKIVAEDGVSKTFAQWQAITGSPDAHSATGDPRFTDASGGVYTLKKHSAAINRGVRLGVAYDDGLSKNTSWPSSVLLVDQDNYWGRRKRGPRWEIGAYPYVVKTTLRGRRTRRGFIFYGD